MAMLLDNVDAAAFGASKERKTPNGISIATVTYQGNWGLQIQLNEVSALWNPDSFEQGQRCTVRFKLGDNTEKMLALERAIAEKCELANPHWAIQEGPSGHTLKLKVDLEHLVCVDKDGQPCAQPEAWREWVTKIIVSPRSYYKSRTGQGLSWVLEGVQLWEKLPARQVAFV